MLRLVYKTFNNNRFGGIDFLVGVAPYKNVFTVEVWQYRIIYHFRVTATIKKFEIQLSSRLDIVCIYLV